MNRVLLASESIIGSFSRKKFRAHFGVSLSVCFVLWQLLSEFSNDFEPKHLLWSLYFMKLYPIDLEAATRLEISVDTFHKWVFGTIMCLYNLFITSDIVCYF